MSSNTTPSGWEHETKPVVTQPTPEAETPTPRPVWMYALGGAGAIIVVALLIARAGTSNPPPPSTSIPATAIVGTATSIADTPTTDPCTGAATAYLKIIADQEQHNQWDTAADNAASALNNKALCTEDRAVIAQRYVNDSLEGLYNRPFAPDKATQTEELERYQTIKHHAQDYGVPFPNPLSVAHRAAQSQMFLVAKLAYEEALEQSLFTVSDMSSVKGYDSVLYNIGDWWTRDTSNPAYNEGLTYLSASYHIADKYKTGQAEAWGRLKELLGPDETIWPDPVATPLLN